MTPVPPKAGTPSGESRTVRGARSCTLCRQMKARCNATEMYPDPCSRCAHLGKGPCVIEPSFRRVNKRARIAEIQIELEELKNTVKQRSRSSPSSDYSDHRHTLLLPEVSHNGAYSPGSSPFASPYSRNEDLYRPMGLTGRIDTASEDELFLTFFTKFHPTLPIVDNTLTPARAYSLCPLLYHTILLLGTLPTPNHTLTWALSQTVNSLAPQQVLTTTKSVHLVQAFLLLATWPQTHPQGSVLHDQAWMYVSVATHMAQCLGLHRSFLSNEYNSSRNETNENTRPEWVRTWVGCFIVSQFLSTALGVNPIITEDFSIQNAPALLSPANSSTYDPALSLLLDKLKMARVGARITGLLSSCPNSSTGLAEVGDNLAIFRVLQGDVQEVEASLLNTDEAHGLSFLWVKIQLYSYALHDGMLPHSARTEFILRGFEASYHFLEEYLSTLRDTPICLLPALHPFSAVCGWMFVLKTLYSRYSLYLDVSATEKTLMDIQKTMASNSQSRGDFCCRAGVYMERLLQDAKANDQNLGEPFLGVRSRMAAGLYYDAIGRMTELTNSNDSSSNNFYETKVMLASPPSVSLSSHTSSPFQYSDDLSTPPTSQVPLPESFIEKPMFAEFWTDSQTMENTFITVPTKVDLDWLADSFLTGEGGAGPSDINSYVAPGMLMAQ